MPLAQHDLLPKIAAEKRTPVTVLKDVVREAISAGEIPPVDRSSAAVVIRAWCCRPRCFMSMVDCVGREQALAVAGIAAVRALGRAAK